MPTVKLTAELRVEATAQPGVAYYDSTTGVGHPGGRVHDSIMQLHAALGGVQVDMPEYPGPAGDLAEYRLQCAGAIETALSGKTFDVGASGRLLLTSFMETRQTNGQKWEPGAGGMSAEVHYYEVDFMEGAIDGSERDAFEDGDVSVKYRLGIFWPV